MEDLEYQLYVGMSEQSVRLYGVIKELEKELAKVQLEMMAIERRRPDIVQYIILGNGNANNTDHEA